MSNDWLLGGVANEVQTFFLLAIFAQITKNKAGKAKHCSDNCHIYEDQFEVMMEHGHLNREPLAVPSLWISPEIDSLEALETFDMERFDEYFKLENYQAHPAITYPFSV